MSSYFMSVYFFQKFRIIYQKLKDLHWHYMTKKLCENKTGFRCVTQRAPYYK